MVYNIMGLINLGLAIAVLFTGVGMLIASRRVNPEVLKAQLFLKENILRKIWVYSTIAGGLLVIHEIAMVFERFSYVKGLSEISMTAFIAVYFLLTYNWYNLLRKSVRT
ncbi:MAG: hypothetical protein V3R93_02505 [Candidatus Hydrothermarchaeaceae archaeon]